MKPLSLQHIHIKQEKRNLPLREFANSIVIISLQVVSALSSEEPIAKEAQIMARTTKVFTISLPPEMAEKVEDIVDEYR